MCSHHAHNSNSNKSNQTKEKKKWLIPQYNECSMGKMKEKTHIQLASEIANKEEYLNIY